MKTALQKAVRLINSIAEKSNDSEFGDLLDNAILSLEAGIDRLTAIDEELDAEADEAIDGKHDRDEAYDSMRDNELTG